MHPVFGDWTPRQSQLGWIDSTMNGGVTTMISAGEVHLPGRPKDIVGLKALAITAQRAFDNFRPGGVKVLAGAPVLEKGMVESDFKEMAEAGVGLLGEVGLGSVKAGYEAKEMVAWARKYGIQSTIHTGGPSIPGSGLIDKDVVLEADADVIGHINGGHTALSEAHVCELCEKSSRAIEIVHNGNERVAIAAAKAALDLKCPHRVILGTDGPAGSGVQPLGILRMVAMLSSHRRTSRPRLVFCFATGNTARIRKLNCGLIEVGRDGRLRVHGPRAAHGRQDAARKRAARRHPGRRHGDDRRHRALRAQPQHAAGDGDSGSGVGPLEIPRTQDHRLLMLRLVAVGRSDIDGDMIRLEGVDGAAAAVFPERIGAEVRCQRVVGDERRHFPAARQEREGNAFPDRLGPPGSRGRAKPRKRLRRRFDDLQAGQVRRGLLPDFGHPKLDNFCGRVVLGAVEEIDVGQPQPVAVEHRHGIDPRAVHEGSVGAVRILDRGKSALAAQHGMQLADQLALENDLVPVGSPDPDIALGDTNPAHEANPAHDKQSRHLLLLGKSGCIVLFATRRGNDFYESRRDLKTR